MIKLLVLFLFLVAFGSFVMYNSNILAFLAKITPKAGNIFYRILGRRVKRINISIERRATLNKGSISYKITNYFKTILSNLGMSKDSVTPAGLVTFITSVSLGVSILFVFWSGQFALAIPTFLVVFYFVVALFRFVSLLYFEKKESTIMDTVDLIAMDVSGGVYNAILRYRRSFHPSIRPYFETFIDNIQNKGYGFKEAMLLLNSHLGITFNDFAQKAILYEAKADASLSDIFTSIIEINRHTRMLRERNNKKFQSLRFEFLVAVAIIALYGVFSVSSDPFMAYVFLVSIWGKLLILLDILIITGVISFLASIKSKIL